MQLRSFNLRLRATAVFLTAITEMCFGQAVSHGPVVGGVTPNSARILVRTSSAAEVYFEITTDSSFVTADVTATDSALAVADFFVTLSAAGLLADTQYFYRAVVNGAQQGFHGSFRTFPAGGQASTFAFAFGGCQQNAADPLSYIGRVYPRIVAERPRFFLQIGDWTYPDTTDTPENPSDFFNVVFSRVQASYRSKYDPNYTMAGLFRMAPVDYVYDDHDYANDNSDMTFPARENSISGYQQMFPHYPLPNPGNGIWHRFTYGNVDFFMLDTRTQRSPNRAAFQQDDAGRFAFGPLPGHRILQADANIAGELQMDWLVRELSASHADWKFICTSVPFNPGMRALMELLLQFQGGEAEEFVRQFGLGSVAELSIQLSDSWNGFPASVAHLTAAVHEAGVENVIVLSADSHTAAMDDGANSLFPEVMAGGLDRSNSQLVALAELLGVQVWNKGGQTFGRNNFNSHYGKVTVFGADSVRLELIDEFGELLASQLVVSGTRVSPVALAQVVEQRDFEEVLVGDSSATTLILISTASDTVHIEEIAAENRAFFAATRQLSIPPGRRADVPIYFKPAATGTAEGVLTIVSNDPESPFHVALRGEGVLATSVDETDRQQPEQFALAQNYPNPFNPETRIAYELSEAAAVTITIYNLVGQQITTLVNEPKGAGFFSVVWDGRDATGAQVGSGVYIYRLSVKPADGSSRPFVQSKKMVLVR